jgi:hypothetical protein
MHLRGMKPTSPCKLDDLTPHQLIDEIKQISAQYGREVTTARRTWPKSIRDRVLALARLGVPRNRIGRECGVPSATVFLWCKQTPGLRRRTGASAELASNRSQTGFLMLPESDTCQSNPTVGIGIAEDCPQIPVRADAGLQIILPGGIEVRGLVSVEQVLALYRGCRS